MPARAPIYASVAQVVEHHVRQGAPCQPLALCTRLRSEPMTGTPGIGNALWRLRFESARWLHAYAVIARRRATRLTRPPEVPLVASF
jgi:hypothetical protein